MGTGSSSSAPSRPNTPTQTWLRWPCSARTCTLTPGRSLTVGSWPLPVFILSCCTHRGYPGHWPHQCCQHHHGHHQGCHRWPHSRDTDQHQGEIFRCWGRPGRWNKHPGDTHFGFLESFVTNISYYLGWFGGYRLRKSLIRRTDSWRGPTLYVESTRWSYFKARERKGGEPKELNENNHLQGGWGRDDQAGVLCCGSRARAHHQLL